MSPRRRKGALWGEPREPVGRTYVPSTLAERFRTAEPCGSVGFVGALELLGALRLGIGANKRLYRYQSMKGATRI